ncbi:Barstar (barnase inhibitor) [Pustulibacterium marinum]|uniref:Barstar (Barnase inhibitor) n=1 Tax=Pustulibacterium marinum TaxID=1224947 RepID=A0A1I7H7G3_9FLAO|nr:barstar family protein [Pustulibacterium marinum]SFU56648.1 Barstar (barnase inhibitor) [Pustulibacterium marinum]
MKSQGIILFHDTKLLDKAFDKFDDQEYKIIEFDTEEITSTRQLHFELKSKLHLPSYYEENFDSLKECLLEYDIEDPGIVLVFEHLDLIPFKNIYGLLNVLTEVAKIKEEENINFTVLAQVDNKYFKLYKPLDHPEYLFWNDKEKK